MSLYNHGLINAERPATAAAWRAYWAARISTDAGFGRPPVTLTVAHLDDAPDGAVVWEYGVPSCLVWVKSGGIWCEAVSIRHGNAPIATGRTSDLHEWRCMRPVVWAYGPAVKPTHRDALELVLMLWRMDRVIGDPETMLARIVETYNDRRGGRDDG